MSDMIQLGQLRSRCETDLGSKIVNEIHWNTINSAAEQMAGVMLITDLLNNSSNRVAKAHKKSITHELKRREDAKLAAQME
jgi:hypothetical protein